MRKSPLWRNAIQTEEQRIADAYSNEFLVAKARETELAASAAQLTGETETSSQAQVTMWELRARRYLRNLSNSFP